MAANRTWDPGPNDVLWNTSSAWSPTGVPTANDNALIDTARLVILNGSTAAINELDLRSRATLSTGGFFLHVQQSSGAGTIQLDGTTTQLIVAPREISVFNAVNTHDLNLSGATLAMAGGVAEVRSRPVVCF